MKILLLDLDGTIRCSTTGNFIESYKGQKPILGAGIAIEHFAARDWQIVGISNQGGIAGGYKSLEDTIKEMEYTLWLFPKLQEIFFCPDFEGRKCLMVSRDEISKISLDDEPGYKQVGQHPKFKALNFRKPGDGMLRAALEKYTHSPIENYLVATEANPNFECWFVGDREEDKGAAEALGVNYLGAETWRRRFLPGMHEFNQLAPAQIRFLEGISL